MILVTPEQLKKIIPIMTPARAGIICGLINEIGPQYGVVNSDILHEFLANAIHESGGFIPKRENLNYSAQGLAETWPHRFAVQPAARNKQPNNKALELHRRPIAIANNVYANRMGNGPESSGDGWDFRGAGYMMITGVEMAVAFAKYKRLPTDRSSLVKMMDKVGIDDRLAMESAFWLFCVVKKLIPLAIADNIEAIRISINGGRIGLDKTRELLERCKKYIP